MNKIQKRRIYTLVISLAGLSLSVALILYALKQNINVYYTPSQIPVEKTREPYRFRLGGMVKPGSVKQDSSTIQFIVTDYKKEISVSYQGILPDLFREGKGVIADGVLNQQTFTATSVLAKHDENYMPNQRVPA